LPNRFRVSTQVRINPTGGSSYIFQAEGSAAGLYGIANPVTFALLIGDDMGSTQVTAGTSGPARRNEFLRRTWLMETELGGDVRGLNNCATSTSR
jgi:hypothetical protein